jgi:tRNA pseudouridine13 synthase
MKGEFEEAVNDFLTNIDYETNEGAVAARKKLKDNNDYKEALMYFPGYLKDERSVIASMANKNDYPKALRSIHRGILIMFIHAVEALIFNAALEERIRTKDFKSPISCARNFYGFPNDKALSADGEFGLGVLPGYNTNDDYITEYEKEIMESIGVKKEDFKIKGMPELSMKGDMRTLLCPIKDIKDEEFDDGIKLNFSIPSGSYATIFLNEIMKEESMDTQSILAKLK